MLPRQLHLSSRVLPLILLIVGGTVLGVGVGYVMWNPWAANYSVIAQSKELPRTTQIGGVSVTFPSVMICEAGEEATRTITILNQRETPRYVVVSLSLVSSSGVDSSTISTLTGDPYKVTIASYGTANDVLSFTPSSNGYAIFDLTVQGDVVGTIALYVVSSL